jgi:UDP-2-acetamido-3-amino-2,3-dideoxy-glucuronate N-acetyltransferase
MKDYTRGQYTIIEEPFRYGDGLFVGSFVHVRPNVTVGENVELRDGVWLGPGVKIGNRVRVFNKAIVSTETRLMDDIYIGPGAAFANAKFFKTGGYDSPVVENGVRVGMNATILPGVVLGEGCVIGAGAVVTKNTKPFTVYMGVPAREVGPVEIESLQDSVKMFEETP